MGLLHKHTYEDVSRNYVPPLVEAHIKGADTETLQRAMFGVSTVTQRDTKGFSA